MHRKAMASAPAATRWNAVRFRGGAPTEGAKRRQRLLVLKTRAPQGWRFDSSALRQIFFREATGKASPGSIRARSHERQTVPAGNVPAAETNGRTGGRSRLERRLQPGLAAPQTRRAPEGALIGRSLESR